MSHDERKRTCYANEERHYAFFVCLACFGAVVAGTTAPPVLSKLVILYTQKKHELNRRDKDVRQSGSRIAPTRVFLFVTVGNMAAAGTKTKRRNHTRYMFQTNSYI